MFITTDDVRDNPEGGRICTVYMNLAACNSDFSLEEGSDGYSGLVNDLESLGFGAVKVLTTKVWKYYNTTMPMDIGLRLESEQGNLATLYATTSLPNAFENVSGAMNSAKKIINEFFEKKLPSPGPDKEKVAPKSFLENCYSIYALPRAQREPSNSGFSHISRPNGQ